ncbi:Cof-type HAD-IIB family hydrolase [Haloplasma contractile]|uniref:Phosphoserine phosphatase protein n=1 Tax=Haloplasma contractile SSD-17B TaxID=1033810 RepID=F7Q1H4_9MOLU|nr:Cof-type HAD-IIB family hydrolase [Haloplasma contractile]ERJ12899.1 phosphoserine phosphatase protein [Haloplasma contractile SSD-17B]
MYKLIALDIDGTLLTTDHKISELTRRTITEVSDTGIPVVICTGRAIQGVEPIIDELNLDLPFITYNGAMILMGKSKELLFEQKLSKEDAIDIYQLGQHYDTTIILWNHNKLYVNKLNERATKYGKAANTEPIVIQDIVEVVKDGATKLLWYDDVKTISKFESSVLNQIGDTINYHTSKPFYLEFVDYRASKALALKRLGQKLNIKQHEMIAVGDGFNDLSMIKYAGLGVAMGNASRVIKEAADYVTYSNDQDGIAQVINKFVFNRS